MADGCEITSSSKSLNKSLLEWNFNDESKQSYCTNVIYDGKRFKWAGFQIGKC